MRNILRTVSFCLSVCAIAALQGCTCWKMLVHGSPDPDDKKIFHNRKIPSANQPYHFNYSGEFSSYLDTVRLFYPPFNRSIPLDSILIRDKTKAFIIYLNGSIVYEQYFGDMKADDVTCVFSVSKSLLSALTGIAIDKGYIKSTEQKITDYIPELLDNDNFNQITIRQLLQMSSGIEWKRNVTFDDDGKFYYSPDIRKLIVKYNLKKVPGSAWEYKNIDAELLCWVIENATKMHLSGLVSKYLWDPMGAEYDAWWSLDRKNGTEKASSSLNAAARDLLKFGCIYLNDGYFNGKQIVPSSWIRNIYTVSPAPDQQPDLKHNFLWWMPDGGADREIVADGYLGQRITINPKYDLVIVKLGDSDSNTNIDQSLLHIIHNSHSQVTGSFTDPRDGQVYSSVVIGNQTWMSENLNYPVPESWCYDDDPGNCDKYGRLYTWKAANEACPASWHLPGDEEWKDLEQFLGMTREETEIYLYRGENTGTKLKSMDAWDNCSGSECNSTGFNALPAGYRMYTDGSFTGMHENARWWSGTTNVWGGVTYGIRRCIYSDRTGIDRDAATMTLGFSVRCIKDAPLPSK